MRIVVDTNVLVSGLLTPGGPCREIIRLVEGGQVSLCLDARILSEYSNVLRRPRLAIDPAEADSLLETLESVADFCPTLPLPHALPDPKDVTFLAVALAAQADCLVTGNLRHFPAALRCGIRVVSPAEFLGFLRQAGT